MGDFLEVRGHHDDRQPLFQRLGDQPVDLRLRADVDTSGRVFRNQQPAVGRQPAADHHLLLVAARERFNGQRGIVGAEADAVADFPRGLGFRARAAQLEQAALTRRRIEKRVLPYTER